MGQRKEELRRTFGRSEDGSTAVEFALVMPPFFLMLFAILETASIFFASTTLENAVLDASRQIRTGQAQVGDMSAASFRQEICDRIDSFMSCGENLVIDVEQFNSFATLEFPEIFDSAGELDINPGFSMGAPGDIVLVRVYYMWDVMTPIIGPLLANANGGETRLIIASGVFRNEPFGSILGDF